MSRDVSIPVWVLDFLLTNKFRIKTDPSLENSLPLSAASTRESGSLTCIVVLPVNLPPDMMPKETLPHVVNPRATVRLPSRSSIASYLTPVWFGTTKWCHATRQREGAFATFATFAKCSSFLHRPVHPRTSDLLRSKSLEPSPLEDGDHVDTLWCATSPIEAALIA